MKNTIENAISLYKELYENGSLSSENEKNVLKTVDAFDEEISLKIVSQIADKRVLIIIGLFSPFPNVRLIVLERVRDGMIVDKRFFMKEYKKFVYPVWEKESDVFDKICASLVVVKA